MCVYGFVDLRLFETGAALLNCLKEMFFFLYKHNFKLINYSMAILVSICLRFLRKSQMVAVTNAQTFNQKLIT